MRPPKEHGGHAECVDPQAEAKEAGERSVRVGLAEGVDRLQLVPMCGGVCSSLLGWSSKSEELGWLKMNACTRAVKRT